MKHSSGFWLSILLLLPASFTHAGQVYTWVDDDGVTHFSETPPANAATDTQLIDILPTPATTGALDEDFYSVIKQAERMESRRLENEKLAAEKKKADAEASKARAEATAIQQGPYNDSASFNARYYPVYPYYPRYGHHPGGPGHGYRPKPVHPIYPGYSRPKHPISSLGKTPGMPGQTGSWR